MALAQSTVLAEFAACLQSGGAGRIAVSPASHPAIRGALDRVTAAHGQADYPPTTSR